MTLTAIRAAETFLVELDPYVPVLSGISAVVLAASGVRDIVKNGFSKRALVQTTMGVGMAALSYYSLNKIFAHQAEEGPRLLCERIIQKATDTTRGVLNQSLIGLNSTVDLPINCTLSKSSALLAKVDYLIMERFSGNLMTADCVVTVAQNNILESNYGFNTKNYLARASLCETVTEGRKYWARSYGAPHPGLIGQVDTNIIFKRV